MRYLIGTMALVVGLLGYAAGSAQAELNALEPSERLSDSRLEPLKDLNGYFPFRPSSSPTDWQQRAEQRRRAIRVALGLWPMPLATPHHAVVHGKRDLGDYTVEKVYFESLPGFFVTGNLYRPARGTGRRPAVLCPHGHFTDGRFGDAGPEAAARERAAQAEAFENGGRNQIQARCAQLARMGCVVFNYDMIGYCDSRQISFELAHGFARQRPEMNNSRSWGLFSPQAESSLQSVMGLQTYNSMRALDWLAELPDVDPQRIAVTGASGGGTQTFILGALDPRPAALIPAVMVSTGMQGGCTCENASLLRIGTGNVEFAALIAPRPLCLISADDWTREMATKGFPELAAHYALLGATEQLEHYPCLQFGHNYNFVSRTLMYNFVNRRLDVGVPTPIVQQEFTRLSRDVLTVWDADHPQPAGGPEFERKLLRSWADDAERQIAAVRPKDSGSLDAYRDLVGVAWQSLIGRQLPTADRVEFQQRQKQERDAYWAFSGIVNHRPSPPDPANPSTIEAVPVACLVPKGWQQGPVAIWLDVAGKAGLWQGDAPRPEVQRLLDRQVAVIGVDLMEQGEHRSGSTTIAETRRVNNDREAAAYTLGYNDSLFAQRVHDVLSVVAFATHHERAPSQIWLIGLKGSGPWAAVARALASDRIQRAAIETQGFRFIAVDSIRHEHLLPGGAKYDDLPGALALAAPQPTWLGGESAASAAIVADAYRSTAQPSALAWGAQVADPIEWLLQARP